jgi:hypothetical protein
LALPRSISVLAIALLAAYVGWANFWYAYDDAFITYRVAYNFASGQGFVYNPGEWFLGITAPGLALLLGLGGRIAGADAIPWLGGLVCAISLGSAAMALYVYGARQGHAAAGLFAGLLLIGNPLMAVTFGGEMPFQIALILWAFVAYDADRRTTAALLLAAAIIVRIDAVLAAAAIGLADLIRTRTIAWRMWLVFALALLPFAALTWYAFGSPLPVTLAAKLAQRDTGFWITFGRGLRTWLHNATGPDGGPATFEFFSWHPRAVGFWVAIGIPLVIWTRAWWLPLGWVLAFVLSYRALKVPFYQWYAAPALVGLAIVAAAGIEGALALVVRLASRIRGPRGVRGGARDPAAERNVGGARLLPILATIAGALLCIAINFHRLRYLPLTSQPHPMLVIYADAGRWLQAHTPPAATIGYHEIGYVGYYARRPMIDPLGLLDPAIPPHIAQRDFLWAYRQRQPEYILERDADREGYGGIRAQEWFQRGYTPIQHFTTPGAPELGLTVFQRIGAQRTGADAR